MKFFFIFISFFVFTGSLYAQQQYYRIELLKEGQAILQTTPVSGSDISWRMSLKGKDCMVRDAFANFDLWNSRVNLQLHVDLADFSRFCGSYSVGDSVHVWVEVTNPEHVLYGYAGENTYAVLQKEYSEDFLGANGINLRPRPRIRVEDKEACGRNGDVITAIVTHAPKGYFVDWVDPRLEPSGSDQARIIGFPGDTVLSLSAILRDRDGKGLDTAYYKLKLKPLPEVEVTPEYVICSTGDAYVLNGTFASGNNYQWIYEQKNLRVAARKTVSFPEIMEDRDVRYELFVTDRVTGCRNSDTAWVYLRPKAPLIDIDTNTTRNDIRISWNADTNYTYSLMSVKWDGYGILEDYHLRHTFTGETDRFALSQKELDTLEFFYMTANRYIPALNRTISSASSDTVGYRFDRFKVNEDKTSNQVISWFFDMPSIRTSGELFDRIGIVNLLQISSWSLDNQGWYNTTKYNKMYEVMPDKVPKYTGIFDLSIGDVYLLSVGKEFSFLQYGKLKEFPERTFEVVPSRTNNYVIALDIRKANLRTTEAIFKDIGRENLHSINLWDIDGQGWYKSTLWNELHEMMPDVFPEYTEVLDVRPGIPLQIDVKKAFVWK